MTSKHIIFGTSRAGLPIPAYLFGQGAPVLILGGVHGDEIEGVIAAQGLYQSFVRSFPFRLQVTLVPMFNIDGVIHCTRANSAGVDLNRNLPTQDWSAVVANPRYHPGPSPGSEPENHALMAYLEDVKPGFILSLHSWHPVLNINGHCRREAEEIARHVGYKVEETIGYPTPGCLGTYAGIEREMPTLTYEIERGIEESRILKEHVPAILEALKITESRR